MQRRSDCPVSFALELLGDRWTLLVVRDLALMNKHSFSELLASSEGIATNVLADRLAKLEAAEIVDKRRDANDGRRFVYRLTEAGKDLLPLLVEVILWGAAHDPQTAAPASFVDAAKRDREGLVRQLRSALDG